MPRTRIQVEALSPGQLAKRWGVSVDRVRNLVETGQIPGAFRTPSVGRYGEAIRVPLATVIEVEQQWAIAPEPKLPGFQGGVGGDRRRRPS